VVDYTRLFAQSIALTHFQQPWASGNDHRLAQTEVGKLPASAIRSSARPTPSSTCSVIFSQISSGHGDNLSQRIPIFLKRFAPRHALKFFL
jgi:hypothetical protein